LAPLFERATAPSKAGSSASRPQPRSHRFMSTRIVCPNCLTAYNATDDQRGRRVRCKQCQAIFHAAEPGEPIREVEPASTASSVVPAAGDNRETQGIAQASPRTKKAPRRISALVLLLVLGGVGGSLLIILSSVFICL